jgi:hypothetical protein
VFGSIGDWYVDSASESLVNRTLRLNRALCRAYNLWIFMAYVWHIWYSGHLMLSLYDLRGTYSRNSLVSTLSACQGWCGLLSQVSKVEGQELLPPGWEVEFFLDRLMWKHTTCSSKRTYCSWGGSCCLSLSVTSNAVQQGQAMSSVCNECKSLYIQLMAKLVLYGRFWCSMEMF